MIVGTLRVRLLLRDRYDNRSALKNYRGPVAVLLAGRDEVIPARFGRELFDSYSGSKRLWIQNGFRRAPKPHAESLMSVVAIFA